MTTNRDDWYPGEEARAKTTSGCRVEWRRQPGTGADALRSERLNCGLPNAAGRLFVVGDSHVAAYTTLFAGFARHTGKTVILYQRPGCYFIHLTKIIADCTAFTEAVLDELGKTLEAGDVVFFPSLRVPRFGDQWGEPDLDKSEIWRRLLNTSEEGFTESIEILRKLYIPGVHFVLELPKPIFPTPLFRCADWFNRANPSCRAGTELKRVFLEDHRQPVVAFARRLRAESDGLSVWDPLRILCPGSICSMQRGDKPLFFDGDHVSGFANRLLLPDFIRKMRDLGVLRADVGGADPDN